MKSTDMTMLEIATHCGFNNSASFNKTFTKTTGKKPTEYRKAYEKH
ncbi:MAG: AraC family transcriptional regulator [Eubacteriales bacterium]